jgi:hypothetical protein
MVTDKEGEEKGGIEQKLTKEAKGEGLNRRTQRSQWGGKWFD